MSADDGLFVEKLFDEEGFGIFYYFASSDEPHKSYYSKENAREVYQDPVAAIVAAHKRQREDMTEYGVSVSRQTMAVIAETGTFR